MRLPQKDTTSCYEMKPVIFLDSLSNKGKVNYQKKIKVLEV